MFTDPDKNSIRRNLKLLPELWMHLTLEQIPIKKYLNYNNRII